jgi:DNA-binding transcriptional regulator YiaG
VTQQGAAAVEVVDEWTGQQANALKRALRLTNETFAAQLGTAVRTVAKWNADPAMVPTPEMQQALDTLLNQSPDDAKARFTLLVTGGQVWQQRAPADPPPDDTHTHADAAAQRRLATNRHVATAAAWLDTSTGWSPGTAERRVARLLTQTNLREVQNRGQRRGAIGRAAIATALRDYYAPAVGDFGVYAARCGGTPVTTSVLTRPRWLDLRLPLGVGLDHMVLVSAPYDLPRPQADALVEPALRRLAEALTANMGLVNAPLYRLLNAEVTDQGLLTGQFDLTNFVSYALTMDLLENELIDALTETRPAVPGALPLRDRYMPDVASVLDVQHRLCAGGPLALFAVARPGERTRRGRPDYLFLIQERSGRVLNSARRLAVIPKAFHQPLVDFSDDTSLRSTLEREIEEELFGREDVDSTGGDSRQADPMHRSRLSEPMRWLMERAEGDEWRMECTGFGFNLVSGNFEFASLIVVEDDEWWGRYGGHVEANWESDSLRRYSSLDTDLLVSLVHDPAWSNEGLFALMQDFQRLAEVSDDRIKLPDTVLEMY